MTAKSDGSASLGEPRALSELWIPRGLGFALPAQEHLEVRLLHTREAAQFEVLANGRHLRRLIRREQGLGQAHPMWQWHGRRGYQRWAWCCVRARYHAQPLRGGGMATPQQVQGIAVDRSDVSLRIAWMTARWRT